MKPMKRERYFRVRRHLLRLQPQEAMGCRVDWWYHGEWMPVLELDEWEPADLRLAQWLAVQAAELILKIGNAIEGRDTLRVKLLTPSAKSEEKK